MGFKVDRAIGSLYTNQLTTPDVKALPMKKARAKDGPMDNVILEAEMHWDGRIIMWKKNSDGGRRQAGYHPGHYIWTGKVWRWVEDDIEVSGSVKK